MTFISNRHDAALLGGGLLVGGAASAAVTLKIVTSNAANAEKAAVKAAHIQAGAIGLVVGAGLGVGLLLGIPKLMDAIHGHHLLGS